MSAAVKNIALIAAGTILGYVLFSQNTGSQTASEVVSTSTIPNIPVLSSEPQIIPKSVNNNDQTTVDPNPESLTSFTEKEAAPINSLLTGLKKRLDESPEDPNGWALLAKSYAHLGQMEKAEKALQQAHQYGFTQTINLAEIKSQSAGPKQTFNFKPLPRNIVQPSIGSAHTALAKTSAKQATAVDNDSARVLLSVKLGSALSHEVSADTPVFIYVRGSENGVVSHQGPPIIALKKRVADFPLYLALTDELSLNPARGLSSQQEVVVGARVALSGDPIQQAGDYSIESKAVRTKASQVVSLTVKAEHQS